MCDIVPVSYIHVQVIIGNREWMATNGVCVSDQVDHEIKNFEEQGKTVILVAADGMTNACMY